MADNLITQNEVKVIPVRLEDLFARVQKDRIFNMYGYTERGEASEAAANAALRMEYGGSRLFLTANNMFGYLYRNIRIHCKDLISIIVPGLRNIYYKYQHRLPINEQALLATSMEKPLPTFDNVYSYNSLQNYGSLANINEYQLFGCITPYDVLHVPVRLYVDLLNKNLPIQVQLVPNLYIMITYNDYDFWDNQYQALIQHIDLPC